MKMDMTKRNELMEKPITLNGKKAYIKGRLLDFPKVCVFNGLSVAFAWETIEHIIKENGGRFIVDEDNRGWYRVF